jgi:bifunctional aspartokinase / homoserine dehydrogenase 1
MRWHIHKFGGTSLGAVGRLPVALERIRIEHAAHPQLAVVVSAFGDSTDWLVHSAQAAELADLPRATQLLEQVFSVPLDAIRTQCSPDVFAAVQHELLEQKKQLQPLLDGISLVRDCSPRTLDQLLSSGEWISAQAVAAALRSAGINALAVDARDLVVTDETPQNARVCVRETIDNVTSAAGRWSGAVPVITGFIGRSRSGRVTTLGRNGSDYTATLFAQALSADSVTVWTDVPGVFTADPKLVHDAYPVEALTYAEALELAHFGTRMFHARTMIPLLSSGARLTIRSTLEPGKPGTRVDATGHIDANQPTCVTSLEQLALLSIESRTDALPAGCFGRILQRLESANVKVWMANQTGLGVSASMVVSRESKHLAASVIHEEIDREDVVVTADLDNVTMVTLVAERMGHQPNVAGRFFQALGAIGVKVRALAQGASQRSISCIIDEADTAVAVRSVHSAFNLAETELNLVVLGRGTVGAALLRQIEQQAETLKTQHRVRVKLVAALDSNNSVFRPEGLTPREALAALNEGSQHGTAESLLPTLARLPVPVLVDCTAASGMEQLYRQAVQHGIHVVGANKKPLTTSWRERERLLQYVTASSRSYLYETTCGASLPVIETLKNLILTGDEIIRIEGSLSGTLGFLCDALQKNMTLSEAVRLAKEKGLTEPHPRDDLSGLDVARKALILARELGASLEVDDIVREPFVPQAALSEDNVDVFLGSLSALDEPFRKRVQALHSDGKVLRYLARIEREAGTWSLRVGPIGVDAVHPAASLRGEEAFVAFTTRRYHEYPLVVRGAGAGGDVTAAGVLADILRLAQNLKTPGGRLSAAFGER